MPSSIRPCAREVKIFDACLVVKHGNGQKLGYSYYEDEPGRRSAAKLLTKTRRGGSANIAKFDGASA